jgi:hypothetical protein
MSSNELNDLTGRAKQKIKKPGVKKRRSYRKPIGQHYRKSGRFVVTTQPAQPAKENFLSWMSWKSWCQVSCFAFMSVMEVTLVASYIAYITSFS